MRGLVHTASVYRRVSDSGRMSFEDTPFSTWKCRIDPLSDRVILREAFVRSTHSAVGEATPTLEKGWKLVEGSNTYLIVHVKSYPTPGAAVHHQEVYLTKAE